VVQTTPASPTRSATASRPVGPIATTRTQPPAPTPGVALKNAAWQAAGPRHPLRRLMRMSLTRPLPTTPPPPATAVTLIVVTRFGCAPAPRQARRSVETSTLSELSVPTFGTWICSRIWRGPEVSARHHRSARVRARPRPAADVPSTIRRRRIRGAARAPALVDYQLFHWTGIGVRATTMRAATPCLARTRRPASRRIQRSTRLRARVAPMQNSSRNAGPPARRGRPASRRGLALTVESISAARG
jgi:hypothetical protein